MRCPRTHIDRNAQSEPLREDPVSAIELVERILGKDVPFRVVTYDGGELGPADASTTIRLVSPNALHRIITARGQEIGFSRAIIAGEIEVEGDVFGLLGVKDRVAAPKLDREIVRLAAEALGLSSREGRCQTSATATTARRSEAPRASSQQNKRRCCHRQPLRRLQRVLSDVARPGDDLQLRGLRVG